jgi:hypothetical protein
MFSTPFHFSASERQIVVDLTKTTPRSVHEKMHGIVQLARTTDKAKALAHGNIGEYEYDSPMDQAVLNFLGIDRVKYLEAVRAAKSDEEIKSYVAPYVHKKTPQELESWNHMWVTTAPVGESLRFMTELRKKLAPERDDITTWADVLDLDEGRTVPHRRQPIAV